ncbi:alpha-hydroxy-acid oxidizing protein [Pelagibacteraceae bacterium]|nr:alpha-hydroxy-acid oxidizing protein [Pelagibacteraceae bacterium]
MNLRDCYNFNDFRNLAKKNLPAPIFHYIDGGSDDETTLKRNTESFLKCDLVPNILASVGEPDISTTVFGQKNRYAIIFISSSNAETFSP